MAESGLQNTAGANSVLRVRRVTQDAVPCDLDQCSVGSDTLSVPV